MDRTHLLVTFPFLLILALSSRNRKLLG